MKPHEKVILLDFDGTLFNDGRVVQDLRRYLRGCLGSGRERRYVTILKRLHRRLGYADYLGALQRYRLEHPADPHILHVSRFLIGYPFRRLVKPGVFRALRQCNRWGPVVILSDGDAVFQPHKIMASGIWEAVAGHVLVFVHKQKMLWDVQRLYPARHYVMVEDKMEVLRAMKRAWKSRVTTVLVPEAHQQNSRRARQRYRAPDIRIARIRDLPRALRRYFASAASLDV
jgi:FMN phosphatase YigB (HAD superfamily)